MPVLKSASAMIARPQIGPPAFPLKPTMTQTDLRATYPSSPTSPTSRCALRSATIDDLDAIVAITNHAFLAEQFCVTGDRTDAADIRQRFTAGRFFVIDEAPDRARLAGSVYCAVDGTRGYLGLLAVHPAAQGRGHARTLLAAVEQHCRDAGCNFLDITVVNVRADLFPLYAKLGFAAMDVLPFPVPDRARQPLQLVKMTKPLRPPAQLAAGMRK
jgi:GNAT superfamily N-acetyltransferase